MIQQSPRLGVSPKEMKAGFQKVICTPVFIGALFTITKRWAHPKCYPTDDKSYVPCSKFLLA